MAHYHLNQKPISRSNGDSSVAAAAYRSRSRLIDERTGLPHDYTRINHDLLFQGIYIPKNAPEWAKDRARLWNEAERQENRVNSRISRDFNLALHAELTLEQNRWMLQDFVRENFTRKGLVADVAIHAAHEYGDDRNIHAHIQITTRQFQPNGTWAKNKDRTLDDEATLEHWRESWAKIGSQHLERHGHALEAERFAVAHLTLEKQREAALERGDHQWARDLDREAQIKLGKTAAALERDGWETERGNQLREIDEVNRQRQQLAELERLAQLEAEHVSAIERQRQEQEEERERQQRWTEREAEHRHRDPSRWGFFAAVRRFMQSIGLAIDSDSLREHEGRRSRESKADAQRRQLEELIRNSSMPPPQAPPSTSLEHRRHEIIRPQPEPEKISRQHTEPMRRDLDRADLERENVRGSQTRPMEVSQTNVQQRPEPTQEPDPGRQRETFLERKRREARERGEIEPEFGPLPSKPRILEMEYRPPKKRRDDEPKH